MDSALATLQGPRRPCRARRPRSIATGLVKQNAVSKQDFDDAIAALAQAKADIASAQASVESARINLDYTKVTAPIAGQIDKSDLTEGALVTANQTTALTTIRTIDPINVDVTASSTDLLNWKQAIKEGQLKFAGPDVQRQAEAR